MIFSAVFGRNMMKNLPLLLYSPSQKDLVSVPPPCPNTTHLSIGVDNAVEKIPVSMRSTYSTETDSHIWAESDVALENLYPKTPTTAYVTNNFNSLRALDARRRSDSPHTASHRSFTLVNPQLVAQGVSSPSAMHNSQISSVVVKPKLEKAGKMVKKLEEKESKVGSRAAHRPSIFRQMLIGLSSPIQRKGKSTTDKSSPSRWRRKSNIDLSFPKCTSPALLRSVSGPEITPVLQETGNVSEAPMGHLCSNQSEYEANDNYRACSHQSVAASSKSSSNSTLTSEMEDGPIVYNSEMPLSQESVIRKESNEVVQQISPRFISHTNVDAIKPFHIHESEPSKQQTHHRNEGTGLQKTEGRDNNHYIHEPSLLSRTCHQTEVYSSLPSPNSSPQNKFIVKRKGGTPTSYMHYRYAFVGIYSHIYNWLRVKPMYLIWNL